MDYEKIYNRLIESKKALNRSRNDGHSYDIHHILPRSLGGTDDEDNLVLLTYKEHFIAHKLLAKIYPGKEMTSALFIMMNAIEFRGKKRPFSAREYERAKSRYMELLKKKTVCLETGVIYDSREEANSAVGLARFSADIVHCFGSDSKTAGGYHWAPFEEGIDYTKNKWFGQRKQEKIVLVRLEDAKFYKSWKEAADDIGVTIGGLSYSVTTIGGAVKGYHLAKYEDGVDYTLNPYFGKEPQKNRTGRVVTCVETGEVFDKVGDLTAAKGYNVLYYQKKHGVAKDGLHYVKEDYKSDQSKSIKPRVSRLRKIECIETGDIFETQAEALRKYDIKSSGGINVAIKTGRRCAGLHWRYYEDCKDRTDSG